MKCKNFYHQCKGWLLLPALLVLFAPACAAKGHSRNPQSIAQTSHRTAVYNEKGLFMPHPDCIAYAQMNVTPSGDMINDLINLGKRYLGKPYRWRGASSRPFDCSGFVLFLYKCFDIALPASSSAMYQATRPVKDVQPGDLVFFSGSRRGNRIGHVGIAIAVDKRGITMLHSSTSRGIVIERIEDSAYFRSRYAGARRIPKLHRYFEAKTSPEMEAVPPSFICESAVPTCLAVPIAPAFEG